MHSEIVVWDFATQEKVATKPYEAVKPSHAEGFAAFAFTPDSHAIVYADEGGRVCLWDGSAGWADGAERELVGQLLNEDSEPISAQVGGKVIAISPDGQLLAVPRGTGPRTGKVVLVEIATGREIGQLEIARGVDSMLFAEEGKTLIVSTPGNTKRLPEVQFWDMDTLTPREPLRIVKPPVVKSGVTNCVAMSPTEKLLSVGLNCMELITEIRLYELPSLRWTRLASNPRFVPFLCFSPDGRWLAVPTCHTRYEPAAVLVYDLSTRKWRRFECPEEVAKQNIAFWSTAFSPDGRYLVGGLYHPQVAVCIWDLEEDADKSRAD